MKPAPREVTLLLRAAADGDSAASDAVFETVYEQLRRLAGSALPRQNGHVLQPTALVNEAWLKLYRHLDHVESRRHFMRIAARAMRQVLINHAEAAKAKKRNGARIQLTTLSSLPASQAESVDALNLEHALAKLSKLNSRHARVIELRFLCSLSIEETAETLAVSHATVERDWSMARAWLRRELDATGSAS